MPHPRRGSTSEASRTSVGTATASAASPSSPSRGSQASTTRSCPASSVASGRSPDAVSSGEPCRHAVLLGCRFDRAALPLSRPGDGGGDSCDPRGRPHVPAGTPRSRAPGRPPWSAAVEHRVVPMAQLGLEHGGERNGYPWPPPDMPRGYPEVYYYNPLLGALCREVPPREIPELPQAAWIATASVPPAAPNPLLPTVDRHGRQ